MNKTITNFHAEKIDYTFTPGKEDLQANGWLVVLGHGVTGNKDRPVIADTAAALQAAGFDTLRFSFTGNGLSGGDFREATISKGVGDLEAVLDAAAKSYTRICYIGHSMGAAVGVLTTAADSRIRCLISLAGMIDTKKFAETEFGSLTPDAGVMWGEEKYPLSAAFMTDLCQTIASVASQAERVNVPWLLIHGTADDVVFPGDTKFIQTAGGSQREFIYIEGADHGFNEPGSKRQATEAVVSWLLCQN